MKKWRIVLFVCFLVVLPLISITLSNIPFTTSKNIKITADNIQKVVVYQKNEDDSSLKKISEISDFPTNINLGLGVHYSIKYTALEGYQSSEMSLEVTNKTKDLKITPFLSDKKLEEKIKVELPSIRKVLSMEFPNIENSYSIQTGKLYHNGEWYGTSLIYNGPDYDNSDSLKVVLLKKNGVWEVETKPPQILLSKYNYKNIPIDILRDVNGQKSPLQNKYRDEKPNVYVPY